MLFERSGEVNPALQPDRGAELLVFRLIYEDL
jgi:hypothetical protein